MKTLDTLPKDIFDLFDPLKTHEPNEDNIQAFGEIVKEVVRTALKEREPVDDPLRFSSLGKPDRQLWYMAKKEEGEALTSKTYFKFLYGHVIEALILFLAKEAGHKVEREQEEIEVNGVKGHIDAIIDGITVDVKSASPFAYKKFENGKIFEDDPFGYIQQISGYANVLTPEVGGAFLAFDKVHGDITILPVGTSITKDYEPLERINHLREVIASETMPPRCYPDVEDGKSGNRKLGTNCSYCPFKHKCWEGLTGYYYSSGPRWLTQVRREPDVPKIPK